MTLPTGLIRSLACLGCAMLAWAGHARAQSPSLRELAASVEASAPAVPTPRTIAYGSDAAQTVDYWPASTAALGGAHPPPLIVFVHGGAWSKGDKHTGTGRWKEAHYPAEGYAFATIDYRLVPGVRVEDEAADVAQAVHALRQRAGELGFDAGRIVLMGHSAGAHLVALVGTDPRYLAAAGLALSDVAGVIAIDGAGYDVTEQLGAAGALMHAQYVQDFGTDPARQRALSPTLQAAAPNVGQILLLHVQRPDGIRQADELAAALRVGGSSVQVNGFPGYGLSGHLIINRRLGDPAYAATPVVDEWLAKLFDRP